jgi:hypothetical protein
VSRRVDGALVASLFCIALVLRLVPLLFSPLPYNVDGFALTAISRDFGATGRWVINESDVNRYDLKLPVFSLLWYAQAQLSGLHPLVDIQWFLPILTSLVVLPMYLIGAKVTGRRLVGFAAGLFLAVFGSFLFLTSSVMKESLGLLLLPTIVLLFHERADPRKRVIAVLLLLVLAFLHHLTLLMAVGSIGALIVLRHTRDVSRGRFSVRTLVLDVVSGLGPFAIGMEYYLAVNLATVPVRADEYILFLALIVVLTAVLAPAWRAVSVRPGRRRLLPPGRILLVPAFALAGAVVNERTDLFAGTLQTQAGFIELLPAVLILAGFAGLGYRVMRRTSNRMNDLVLSTAVAPIALALFGFLRGLDIFSLYVVYRSFDFLDYALALLAGVGLAFAWRRLGKRRVAGVGLAVVFMGALLATTPMAWNSQQIFSVENVTSPGEFQALSVVADLGGTSLASDQRITAVGRWWFGFGEDRTLPYAISEGSAVSGSDYAIVLERWTTVGAQEFPRANAVVDRASLDDFLSEHIIVYVTGVPGDRIYVVRVADSSTG